MAHARLGQVPLSAQHSTASQQGLSAGETPDLDEGSSTGCQKETSRSGC